MSEHSFIRRFIIGFFMGSADLVPGVSGGTIAFVAGVFEPIVEALHKADRTALRFLLTLKWGELARHLNLPLVGTLLAGMATAIFTLAHTLDNWLDTPLSRSRLFAFFLGLVIISIVFVRKRVIWTRSAVAAAVIGGMIGLLVIWMTPASTPQNAGWAVASGALAISAMVLPGISGSFVLLLAGQYDRAIEAASSRDFPTLLLFAAGAVVGVLSIVRLLRLALKKWHNNTLAALVGLMIGTAPRLWPWGTSPADWAVGAPKEIAVALALFGLGVGVLIFFQKLVGVREKSV